MVVLLLRVLGKVVGVMERVMLGLAPGIILGFMSGTDVVVRRFVLPMLPLFHPSLLPSTMRGEIVATVTVVAGEFVIRDQLGTAGPEADRSRLPLERTSTRDGGVTGCGSSSGPSKGKTCSTTLGRTTLCRASSKRCLLAESI